ncbi:hypothetical protein PN441_13310 [Spirulina major CS-329]|jgi:hypothetical protein|uniref:DUF6761 family protein n=1 Tax=Spirulina TaxID=1154 RepID=UPI000933B059|nr:MULTISPECIES: DUF6761 family protein [Spirulina]MDB9495018.1 hypothetical protein [Spirulina subsalsa CS-330]MDB9504048.1 hypothetical protein [Spirulina major CS-329]
MLTDTRTIRYYQRLTDGLVDLWRRGNRYSEMQLYLDGYIASLRHSNALEPYLIHRLEAEVARFLRDPSNFELALPQTETELDYY